jgi:hypothetical protein
MISEGEAHFYTGVEQRPECGVLLDRGRIVIEHFAIIRIVFTIKFTGTKFNLDANYCMLLLK